MQKMRTHGVKAKIRFVRKGLGNVAERKMKNPSLLIEFKETPRTPSMKLS